MNPQKTKIILDTNTIINGYIGDFSYPSRIIDECFNNNLEPLTSRPIQGENKLILKRLIKNPEYHQHIQRFLNISTLIYPTQKIENVLEDPEDEKFLECALEGNADYIITEDHHLLDIDNFKDTRIVTPEEFWNIYTADSDDAWSDWAKQIGLT